MPSEQPMPFTMAEITAMKNDFYKYYPKDFSHPEDEGVYHYKWISEWEPLIQYLVGVDDVVGVEIGTNYGAFASWASRNVLTGKNTMLYTIDVNYNKYILHNLKNLPNVTFIQGESGDVLKTLTHKGQKKEFAYFVYVDGNHFAANVLEDAVLGFSLLKEDGLIIFDDYGWGIHTEDESVKPKTGVDAFCHGYKGHYDVVATGWQIFLQKKKHTFDPKEIENNYYGMKHSL